MADYYKLTYSFGNRLGDPSECYDVVLSDCRYYDKCNNYTINHVQQYKHSAKWLEGHYAHCQDDLAEKCPYFNNCCNYTTAHIRQYKHSDGWFKIHHAHCQDDLEGNCPYFDDHNSFEYEEHTKKCTHETRQIQRCKY